jgi:hypothetical protein
MKVCNLCGNNVNDTESYCPTCGNNLTGIQPVNNNMHYNHQNPAYGNQQMVNQQPMYNQQGYQQQPMMNQYYQPVSNNASSTGEIVGAIIAAVGLFVSFNTAITVFTSFEEFYTKQILNPKYIEYAGNASFWSISVALFPFVLGLIATIIGAKKKKENNKAINKFTFFSGLACLATAVANFIYVMNYFG